MHMKIDAFAEVGQWSADVPTECGTYWAWHIDAEAPNPIRIVDIRRDEDQERPGEIVREVFFGDGAGWWEYDGELAEHERRDDVRWCRFNMPASPWDGDE